MAKKTEFASTSGGSPVVLEDWIPWGSTGTTRGYVKDITDYSCDNAV